MFSTPVETVAPRRDSVVQESSRRPARRRCPAPTGGAFAPARCGVVSARYSPCRSSPVHRVRRLSLPGATARAAAPVKIMSPLSLATRTALLPVATGRAASMHMREYAPRGVDLVERWRTLTGEYVLVVLRRLRRRSRRRAGPGAQLAPDALRQPVRVPLRCAAVLSGADRAGLVRYSVVTTFGTVRDVTPSPEMPVTQPIISPLLVARSGARATQAAGSRSATCAAVAWLVAPSASRRGKLPSPISTAPAARLRRRLRSPQHLQHERPRAAANVPHRPRFSAVLEHP